MVKSTIVGLDPFEADGITMRRSPTGPDGQPIVPDGMQVLYREGKFVGVGHFGMPAPSEWPKADTIVLSPMQYEAVKKNVMERPERRARKAAMLVNKAPTDPKLIH